MRSRLRIFSCCWLLVNFICSAECLMGQANNQTDVKADAEAMATAWLTDLYTPGVRIEGDSVYFNDETRKITTDSSYRKLIYPEQYTWEMVQALLNRKILKPAIWYMINLFHADEANQELVLKMILPLDQTLEMDKVLIATYYTYLPFDPEVYEVKDGRTVKVKRPDIAEQKLMATQSITEQVFAQRVRMTKSTD